MMTIIVLWILISIIALIVILLHFSVSAYIKADDEGFKIKVKYFFITFYPRKPKKKNKKIKTKKEYKVKEFSDSLDDEFGQERFSENEAAENINVLEEKRSEPDEQFIQNDLSFANKEKNKRQTLKKEHKKTEPKNNKSKKEGNTSSLKEKYNKIKSYLPMGWKYFKKLLKTVRITDVKINIDVGREDAHEAAVYYGAVQGALFNILGQICNMFSVKIKKADVNCIFTKNVINGSAECYIRVRPSSMIAIAFCIGVNFLVIFLKQKRNDKSNQVKNAENKDESILEVK